jgi:hypothetical protein
MIAFIVALVCAWVAMNGIMWAVIEAEDRREATAIVLGAALIGAFSLLISELGAGL